MSIHGGFTPADIFLLLWEFPQNMAGLVLFCFLKAGRRIVAISLARRRVFIESSTAISLGLFIFWIHDPGNRIFDLPESIRDHEYGHSVQSRMLGPLYLFIVGVPSSLRTLYARWYFRKHGVRWDGYFRGFPENWANRLGGRSPGKKGTTDERG